MSLIRARQGVVTRRFPHNANRRYIVPGGDRTQRGIVLPRDLLINGGFQGRTFAPWLLQGELAAAVPGEAVVLTSTLTAGYGELQQAVYPVALSYYMLKACYRQRVGTAGIAVRVQDPTNANALVVSLPTVANDTWQTLEAVFQAPSAQLVVLARWTTLASVLLDDVAEIDFVSVWRTTAPPLLDKDGDGLPDTVLQLPGTFGPGSPGISIDADSINIDKDGDGVADVVIPWGQP